MSTMTASPPAPVPSPCISVCRMDAQGLCEGCLRTLDEIAAWSTLDDAAKRVVWLRIEQRQAQQFSLAASPTR
jgi:predicted Fe-S protein YdhL (DUF1289 family)